MGYNEEDYTKFYIVQALFILMKEYKFDYINVTDIANKAGVGRATFYRKFKSKEEIIYYYLNNSVARFNSKISFIPRCVEDYKEITKQVLLFFKEEKEKILLLISAHLEHIYTDFVLQNMKLNFESNYPSKFSKYCAAGYAGLITGISIEWLKNDCSDDVDDIANLIISIIFQNNKN